MLLMDSHHVGTKTQWHSHHDTTVQRRCTMGPMEFFNRIPPSFLTLLILAGEEDHWVAHPRHLRQSVSVRTCEGVGM